MPRDHRFKAVHRGGSLDAASHRLLASWAAECAAHLLPLFAMQHPDDDRVQRVIEAARAWSRGEITVGAARKAAIEAHAAAREAAHEPAKSVARAAGHAAATAHMADHALGPVYYGAKAVRAVSPADPVSRAEHVIQWQCERIPGQIRELVLSAIEARSVLGKWWPRMRPGPATPTDPPAR